MFNLHFSNRFEALSARLAQRLAERQTPPLEEDLVVVPNAAVRRALTLELARRHGVCANLRFVYLAQWLWSLVARIDPSVPRGSPFDIDSLTWRTYEALNDAAFIAPFPTLRRFLASGDALTRFELAGEVAGLLSGYATYRNDWLEAWQRGERALPPGHEAAPDEAWQIGLWRRIAAGLGLPAVNPLRAFAERLAAGGPVPVQALPAEAHLFCLPDIPPLHLAVLRAIGTRMALNVYTLNPCEEFWFDLVDPGTLARLEVAGKRDHHQVGHRLLAAWGRQAGAHLHLLAEAAEDGWTEELWRPTGGATLLHRLQDSILTLSDLAPGSVPRRADDRSIAFHACHSRARELEVLHDRLLALFSQDPSLAPSDVLVVTPDLESAAPLIEAVFGSVPPERRIPYAVTGLGRADVNPVARALLAVLALARSRWQASEVQACLESPAIAARFGLDEDALEQVRGWIEAAGIRWGADAEHRAALGLPASQHHTFEDGLQRLFLGYALPEGLLAPFAGRLPAGDSEGSAALALGALARFVRGLGRLRARLAAPLPLRVWSTLLTELLAEFVEARQPEDLREVETAIAQLTATAAPALSDAPLPAEVLETALRAALDEPARGGVPSGAVTFSAISSLRGLPFRVVCMVGLDDGSLPGLSRPREFDLIAAAPRVGDRQRRTDDRNLFLDQILAARDVLHLSFVGRGVRDNAERPPSVLVAELIEYLALATASDPTDPACVWQAREQLVWAQPLQAFSARAFLETTPHEVRSFNREFADALNARAAAPPPMMLEHMVHRADEAEGDEDARDDATDPSLEPASPFFAAPVAPHWPPGGRIALEDLLRFFRNPSRFLLSQALGIRLMREVDEVLDDEPFVASRQDARALSDRLMPRLLGDVGPDEALALALAGTEVPPGSLGRFAAGQAVARMEGLAARARWRLAAPLVAPHTVALPLQVDGRDWVLEADFADLRAEGLVRWRDDEASGADRLQAWLIQLLLWEAPPPVARPGVSWLCRDVEIGFRPPTTGTPRSILEDLVALYLRGLCEPLPFFPRSAWAFARTGWKASEAVKTWKASERQPYAESSDPACRLAFRGRPDPLTGPGFQAFEDCARTVFEPLLACIEERR